MTNDAILCVDDESIIVLSIKQELKSYFQERFIYETALSGEEAFEIVEELSKDGITLILIISDWLMPGMKGDEFLRKVKKLNPNIKTILITGHASQDAIEKIKNEKLTNAIMLKPWINTELIDMVKTCIETPSACTD